MTTVKNDLAYIAGYLESYLEDGGDIQMQCLFDDVLALIAKPKDNQIIVDELRPMSDFPKTGEVVLGYRGGINTFLRLSYFKEKLVNEYGVKTTAKSYLGWIPMPIYQPKK